MDGILIIDKPQGMTSHDVVDIVRRAVGVKKVGHAGTLDPMATGVLIVLIGSYTKLSQKLMSDEKEYDATLTIGCRSDTGDAWGKLDAPQAVPHIKRPDLERAFSGFVGEIEQVPPMYSAVRFKGRKLYKLARKGLTVEAEPRKILIKRLDIKEIDLPRVSFSLVCSKGTYVRQLCVDIGEVLGCGAHLSRLTRTRCGDFTLASAVTVDELKKTDVKELSGKLLTV